MIDLEDSLSQGIPHGEAAAYFIRLRGTDKVATVADFERVLETLPEEDRVLLRKLANEPAQLPPTAQGQVMKPPSPAPLPAAASGQHGMKMASDKTDDAVGQSRGRAATSAHFERDSHRQSEKNRELGGRLAGAAAGGAAAHFGGKKNPLSTLVGVALGSHLGGKAGKRSGQVADAKRWDKEKSAAALKHAFDELGVPVGNPQLQGSAPPFAQPAQPGQPPRPAAGPPPVNTPPPAAIEPIIDPETQAFLEQEQAADAEAETAHLDMLRQKLQQAQSELQESKQLSDTLQQTQGQHDATLQQMQQQVADSFQQAAASQDEVLKNQQAAAAMRMAYQQLRGQVLQLAAADPPTLSPDAQALMAAQAAPNSAPSPQAGPAGQAPSPGAAPGAAPPEGETAVNQNAAGTSSDPVGESSPASTTGQKDQPSGGGDNKGSDSKVSLKIGQAAFAAVLKEASIRDMLGQLGQKALGALPHAAAGAAIGAGLGAGESFTSNEPLRQKVQQHEANPNRGLRDTMDLAQAKARLTMGEFAEQHPAAMMGAGALGGALLGAQHGPGVVDAVRQSGQQGGDIAKKIKLLITKGAA